MCSCTPTTDTVCKAINIMTIYMASCFYNATHSFSVLSFLATILFVIYYYFIDRRRRLSPFEKRIGNLLYTTSFACFIGFTFFIFPIDSNIIYAKYGECYSQLGITKEFNKTLLPYIVIVLHSVPVVVLYSLGFRLGYIIDILILSVLSVFILLNFGVYNMYPFEKWKVATMVFKCVVITYLVNYLFRIISGFHFVK
jgi:hypothetical protein